MPAFEGYGEYNKSKVYIVPLDNLNNKDVKNGDIVYSKLDNKTIPIKVINLTDDYAVMDFNHSLAGKNLLYNIKIKDIKKLNATKIISNITERE